MFWFGLFSAFLQMEIQAETQLRATFFRHPLWVVEVFVNTVQFNVQFAVKISTHKKNCKLRKRALLSQH